MSGGKKADGAHREGAAVRSVRDARRLAAAWLAGAGVARTWVEFGLPEVDDRYAIWRVPLLDRRGAALGELVLEGGRGSVDRARSTDPATLRRRLGEGGEEGPDGGAAGRDERADGEPVSGSARPARGGYRPSEHPSTVIQADAREALAALPEGAAELVFTSPPYFNARTQYSDHDSYEDYLAMVRQVIRATRRVLAEGRFFVLNASPVLLRRARRSEASRRIAVPFDIHRLFVEEGFDFMEDIVWVKPEGAGWATGRGRRFAADRHPLQYKPVPVTEQILVYRKRTHRLLDWNIRSHPEPARVARSRIGDGYEVTNVWRIKPAHRKEHPAVFPRELAERVVRYWSFEGDVVLDPFAGVGTTGAAAAALGRRFLLIERNPEYVRVIRRELPGWEGADPEKVHWRGGET